MTISKLVAIPATFEAEWAEIQKRIVDRGGFVRDAFGPLSCQPVSDGTAADETVFQNSSVEYSTGLAPHETELKALIANAVKKQQQLISTQTEIRPKNE